VTGGAEATALAPVRTHMLREARMEADRILEQAHAEAAATVSQARRGADETIALAGTQGQADGAPAAAAERSRGREQARSILFGAQREAYEELRGQVLAAVGGLPGEPGYDRLLSRLTVMAGRVAGPDATITVQPAGGVAARARDMVVDCTLPKLAVLAVDALGDQVRELWTP
jgi:vacuolar-type H+-ATPase subunit E/Vma4